MIEWLNGWGIIFLSVPEKPFNHSAIQLLLKDEND
jgi:hypothetical protein